MDTNLEVIFGIILTVSITVFCVVGIVKLAGLIKAWINRNKSPYDEEDFHRLARAFVRYKKETERRLQKLEKDAERPNSGLTASEKHRKEERLQEAMQVEPSNKKAQAKIKNEDLRNMLRE